MSVGILLTILVVLAVIGSLLWILPSEADRRRMRLRQQAMSQGIKVREAREEMKRWGLMPAKSNMLMQYYRLDANAGKEQWRVINPAAELPEHPELQAKSLHPAGPDVPWPELPSDLVLWEKEGTRYGFYWYERGAPEQLARALEYLKTLR